jgi:hypothetical protein
MRIMDNFSASDLTAGDSMVMLEARAQQMAADEVRAKTAVVPGAPSAAGTNVSCYFASLSNSCFWLS